MIKKYEKQKEKTLEEISRPLLNIVTYESIIKNDLLDYFLSIKVSHIGNELKSYKYSQLLSLKNEETDLIVNRLKRNNQRCREISENIYKKSKLSNLIAYSEISTDLVAAVKSVFILSASKANPGKLIEMRINSLLSLWIDDFKSRKESTETLCKKAIYLSVMCPDFLAKHDDSIPDALEKTKGGSEISKRIMSECRSVDFEKAYFPSAIKIVGWLKAKRRWSQFKAGG